MVQHGATEDIRIEAHPHIGTNKLPKIIKSIRETIIEYGGKLMFNSRVIDINIKNNAVTGVELQDGTIIEAPKIILATGHSARDIFELLHKKEIEIEAKAFALGIRVEHTQELIDKIQYKCEVKGRIFTSCPILHCKTSKRKRSIFILYVSWWYNCSLRNKPR